MGDSGSHSAILWVSLFAAALSFSCASDQESAPVRSFYAEVAVEAEAQLADPLARFGSGGGRSLIRW